MINYSKPIYKNKIIVIITILCMFFQLFMPSANIYGEDVLSLTVTDVCIKDLNGNNIEEEEIDINSGIRIEYYFDIPLDAKEGDKAFLSLPEMFKIDKHLKNICIKSDTGEIVANVEVNKERLVTIVFTDKVTEVDKAVLNFQSAFDKDKIGNDNEDIEFKVDDKVIKIISIKFKAKEKVDPEIKKTGEYDSDNYGIRWNITISPNQELDDVTLIDTLGEYLTYKPETFEVDGVKVNPEISGNTISYKFPNKISKDIKVTLLTTIDPDAKITINDKGAQVRRLENKAKLKIEDSNYNPTIPGYEPEDSETIDAPLDFLSKYGTLCEGEKDKIKWVVTIKATNTDLTDVEYIDEVEEGLSLITSSDNKDELLQVVGNDTIKPIECTEKGFRYNFNKIPKGSKIEITYLTKITDKKRYMINGENNYACYYNKGILKMDGCEEIIIEPSIAFKPEMVNKEFVDYNYSTKEATWLININMNNNKKEPLLIEDPKLIDEISQGQEYVKNSLEVSKNDSEFKKVDDSFVNYDNAAKILTYDFSGYKDNNTISDYYVIKLKTKVNDPKILSSNEAELTNKAYINGNGSDKECFSEVEEHIKDGMLSKNGTFNESDSTIEWNIEFNKNGINLKDGIIEDELPEGVIFQKNSIHLYKAIVDADGSTSKGEELAINTDYTVESSDNSVKVKIPNVNSCCILTFTTKVDKSSSDAVNVVTLSGTGIENQEAKSDNLSSIIAGGGGTAIGNKGKVLITKVDALDNSKKLLGAKYKIYDENKKLLSRNNEAVTNEEGIAQFNNLKLNTKYYVKEIEAPKGYSLDNEYYEVTIGDSKVGTLMLTNKPYTTKTSSSKHHHSSSEKDNDDKDNDPKKREKDLLSDVVIIPSKSNNTPDNSANTPVNTQVKNNNLEVNNIVDTSTNSKSNSDKTSNNKDKRLPQSGSMIDQKVLIFMGLILIFSGLSYGYKKKKILSNIK